MELFSHLDAVTFESFLAEGSHQRRRCCVFQMVSGDLARGCWQKASNSFRSSFDGISFAHFSFSLFSLISIAANLLLLYPVLLPVAPASDFSLSLPWLTGYAFSSSHRLIWNSGRRFLPYRLSSFWKKAMLAEPFSIERSLMKLTIDRCRLNCQETSVITKAGLIFVFLTGSSRTHWPIPNLIIKVWRHAPLTLDGGGKDAFGAHLPK